MSHDPSRKGVPRNWRLPIRDLLIYAGARFICPCAGDISLMPGTASDPAYRRVDIDTKTGKVKDYSKKEERIRMLLEKAIVLSNKQIRSDYYSWFVCAANCSPGPNRDSL